MDRLRGDESRVPMDELTSSHLGSAADVCISQPLVAGSGHRARALSSGLSALCCLALAVCYAGRFDSCAALTVFPAWAWLVPGLGVAALGLSRRGKLRAVAACAAWAVFVLVFAEEPWSLLWSWTAPPSDPRSVGGRGGALRVVSLNCNVGNGQAAAEVASYRPDIVLLQESPGRGELESLASALFGASAGVVHGPDASMIVHGRVVPADLTPEQRSYFVQARVLLKSGLEVEVFSLRLVPAVFRLDLWSPECWREQARNRRRRRAQVSAVAARIALLPRHLPVILGGDFNAPQGDTAFRPLAPRLHDAFREGGRGWGNTITNDTPFLRIDQVWVSDEIRALGVVARRTVGSDHRIVVCNLAVRLEGDSGTP